MSRPVKWTRLEAIAALREYVGFAAETGVQPSHNGYEAWRKKRPEELPSARTIERDASWNQVRREVADDPDSVRLRHIGWGEKEIIESVRAFCLACAENNVKPTLREYEKWRDPYKHPQMNTICRAIGSWRIARQRASLQPE